MSNDTMADSSMDALARLRQDRHTPDQLRAMLQVMVEQLMGTEVDGLCGAGNKTAGGKL